MAVHGTLHTFRSVQQFPIHGVVGSIVAYDAFRLFPRGLAVRRRPVAHSATRLASLVRQHGAEFAIGLHLQADAFQVGGGIATVDDFRDTLRAGADKVSVNSQAVKNPKLISDAAEIFGSQCVVVGIDAKRSGKGGYSVFINGGRLDMGLDLGDWVKEIEERGAGEICLNSIDTDGTKAGFDIEMLNFVCSRVKIPVIASGGCGKLADFSEVFEKTPASAALAASLFHFRELTVGEVKEHLKEKGMPVRR